MQRDALSYKDLIDHGICASRVTQGSTLCRAHRAQATGHTSRRELKFGAKLAFFWGFGGFLKIRMAATEDALFRSIEGMQTAAKKPWY